MKNMLHVGSQTQTITFNSIQAMPRVGKSIEKEDRTCLLLDVELEFRVMKMEFGSDVVGQLCEHTKNN